MQTVEDRLELPTDFWETLDLAAHRKEADFFVDSGAAIESRSQYGRLRVQTKRHSHGDKRENYSTVIYNEDVLASRESSQISPLDVPGYVVGSKVTDSFTDAVSMHLAVSKRLNDMSF